MPVAPQTCKQLRCSQKWFPQYLKDDYLRLASRVLSFLIASAAPRRLAFDQRLPWTGDSQMKTFSLLVVVCIACAAGASAQSLAGSARSSQPQIFVMPEYTQHASQTSLASGHDLLEHSGVTSAHGERPLWELMPEARVTPLGDSARALRKEHVAAKKAVNLWSN